MDGAGQTIKNFVDVGVLDHIDEAITGPFWTVFNHGTVSVTHKNILIHDEMTALMRASNFGMTWAAAYAQSTGDVTTVLVQAKADPSQANDPNNDPGLAKLKKYLYIGLGLFVLYFSIELYLDYKGAEER